MEIVFSPKAIEGLQYWRKSGNVKVLERIKLLIEEIQKIPFEGIGKPEALNLTGAVTGPEELRVNTVWCTKCRIKRYS